MKSVSVIYERDLLGNSVRWATGLQDLLGLSAEEISPSCEWWLERIHAEDRAAYQQALGSAEQHRTRTVVEYRVASKDGGWVPVLDSMQPATSQGEHATHLLGTLETPRQTADRPLAKIVHDLRSPLGAIKLWIELLGQGLDQDQHSRAVEGIANSARSLEALVNDLRDLSVITER